MRTASGLRLRQTCFWGLFRSAAIASRRPRSAEFKSMMIPVRIPRLRTAERTRESPIGFNRWILSTSGLPAYALMIPLVVIGTSATPRRVSGLWGDGWRWFWRKSLDQLANESGRGRQSDKAGRTAPGRSRSGRPPRTLMDWIQHDHRYLALGLELIVGVRRPKFERLFPKSKAFLAAVVLARAFTFLVPTCTSTSGFARILRYHPGCWGAPPFEATTK